MQPLQQVPGPPAYATCAHAVAVCEYLFAKCSTARMVLQFCRQRHDADKLRDELAEVLRDPRYMCPLQNHGETSRKQLAAEMQTAEFQTYLRAKIGAM